MMEKEVLAGGREGKIFRKADRVLRPSNVWTPHVHRFLRFLYENSVTYVPKPYGLDESGMELLSYVPGEVHNYPLPNQFLRDEMIESAAKLLLSYHKVSENYLSKLTNNEVWMLPAVHPIEVMCHGDFAPYNVTIIEGKAIGIIDFDTLHPGPKIWDIAYAVYRWVPFTNPTNPDCYDSLEEQIRKARLFLDSYGLNLKDRELLPITMVDRLAGLVKYMTSQAESGNEDFKKNIEDGHQNLYLNDIQYIQENTELILKGLYSI